MKNIRTIKYNFVMNLILTGSNFLFPLITFPYISRVLQPEGIGKVAFSLSVISYFMILALFGVSSYGIREVAQVRDNKDKLSKVTQEILFINFCSMIFSYIIFTVILFLSDKLWQEKELLIIISMSVLFTILGVEWFYKGIEKYQYITVRTIILRLIALVLTFLLLNSKEDYLLFAVISIFSIIGSGIINIVNIRKYINVKLYYNYKVKRHLKPMTLLFLTSLAIAIYTNVDATMLGLIKGNIDVGYYNTAIKIKSILLSIVTSLGVVLLPRLSYYVKNNMMNEFNLALNKSLNFIILISLPIIVFFISFSRETILVLAGDEYLESVILLQIVMLTIIMVGITNIIGIQILLPLKKDKELLISVVVAAVLNILLNLFFIPRFGAIGAAISTTIAEFIVLVIQLIFIKSYLKILFSNIQYTKIILAVSVSLLLVKYGFNIFNYSDIINLLLLFCSFFVSYLILILSFKEKFFYENILTLIKNKFQRKL